jgi:hypothetical protein
VDGALVTDPETLLVLKEALETEQRILSASEPLADAA